MIKAIQKNGLILGAFALVTTSIIAVTYSLTHERIDAAKERQLLGTLNQVVVPSLHDNQLHIDCIRVDNSELLGKADQRVFRARLQQTNTALIIETTAPNGYSGAIDMVVAVDTNMNVLGTRVVAHKETPGLGDKIDLRISDWILSFNNVPYNEAVKDRWQVKKDGGRFDQFTGATITPRAVVSAAAKAAEFAQQNMDTLFSRPANCASSEPATQGKAS
ncbi:MAG: electron transport complex subunit RsxG [Glaciecola sp.]